MIAEFKFKNFKSYKDATLSLSSLTLLIGANASGKSNALEGIRFLSWLAQGKNLNEIVHEVEGADTLVRGSISDLTYNDEIDFSLGCVRQLEDETDWPSLDVTISPTEDEDVYISEEKVSSPKESLPLYHLKKDDNQIGNLAKVSYNNFLRGQRKPQIQCINQKAIFTQLESPAAFDQRYKKSQQLIPLMSERFREDLEGVRFLEPVPIKMRAYNNVRDTRLKEDGANISSALKHLVSPTPRTLLRDGKRILLKQISYKKQILAFIQSLPEQDVKDIDFIVTERNDVMLQLIESFGETEQKRDAAVLSDGTLRVLAIAVALYSAPKGALVIIEEIDNGVHPSRANLLINNIQKVAEERNFNVLLTSHNPALLDALPVKSIPDVVCCYRDPQGGDSRLIKLDDFKTYPELIAQGPVGQLMTLGILERFLKDQTSDEQKQQNNLDWFDSLLESEADD